MQKPEETVIIAGENVSLYVAVTHAVGGYLVKVRMLISRVAVSENVENPVTTFRFVVPLEVQVGSEHDIRVVIKRVVGEVERSL